MPSKHGRPLSTAVFALKLKLEKTMHLLIMPILADAGMNIAGSGAVVIVILYAAAIIRSKMP